jgi:sec-independent protein translocase protein TatB
MFDIAWSEMLLIGAVALVVIGPKDLPKALRSVGQAVGKVKRMAAEFQGQFNDAMREAELHDIKKKVEDIGGEVKAATSVDFNPIQTIRDELKSVTSAGAATAAGTAAAGAAIAAGAASASEPLNVAGPAAAGDPPPPDLAKIPDFTVPLPPMPEPFDPHREIGVAADAPAPAYVNGAAPEMDHGAAFPPPPPEAVARKSEGSAP